MTAYIQLARLGDVLGLGTYSMLHDRISARVDDTQDSIVGPLRDPLKQYWPSGLVHASVLVLGLLEVSTPFLFFSFWTPDSLGYLCCDTL